QIGEVCGNCKQSECRRQRDSGHCQRRLRPCQHCVSRCDCRFRAKYSDEGSWKEKVEPYQERVLEKKRDALIDYLLRGPDAEFPDAREMYKYFLIDGEVDGCFRTSRVVAACSSLQLYVHRIRMNLEKEPNGLHVQPSLIPDEEWAWRQYYR